MAAIVRLPLTDPMPGSPVGTQDALLGLYKWSDPRRTPLNLPYGDNFAENTFAQLRRKWPFLPNGTVASDFDFNGNSLGFHPAAQGRGIGMYAPSGDSEAVLEVGNHASYPGTGIDICIGYVDASGNGAMGGIYQQANLYTWVTSTWNSSTTGGNVASGVTVDGRHSWLAVRKTGTTVQARASNDGSTWTSLTSGSTIGGSAPYYVVIFIVGNNPSLQPSNTTLYRFNVFTGSYL